MATSTTPPSSTAVRSRDPERRARAGSASARPSVAGTSRSRPTSTSRRSSCSSRSTGLFPLALHGLRVACTTGTCSAARATSSGSRTTSFVLQEPNFWKCVRNTFSIFLLSTVPQLIIAIVLAALLDANLRARTFWRMGVLLPYVVAPVAVSLIFGKLFADKSGLINTVLGYVGIDPIALARARSSPATSRSRRWSTSAGPATTP